MRKYIYLIAAVCAGLFALASCSETEETTTEYDNWQERNDLYWSSIVAQAKDSIAAAQAAYGTDWAEEGNWLGLLTFSKQPEVATGTDSVYIQKLRRGTSDASPLHTDTVRLRLRGRLMPSASYPDGYLFLHTGLYTDFERTFDETSAGTATYGMSALVRGLETALLNMKKGDLWRIYVPYNLGYGSTAQSAIPAYSTLVFEAQIAEIYPAGSKVTTLKGLKGEATAED